MNLFRLVAAVSRVLFLICAFAFLQACTQTAQNSNFNKASVSGQNKLAVKPAAQTVDWQKIWQQRMDEFKTRNSPKKETVVKKPVKKKIVKASSGRARYDALIRKYARANGVPIKLAHAVVFVESSYRANARGDVGEIGLMQLRLATARGMGYRGSAKALYNPETNIKYGMKYLGKAYKLGGRTTCGAILRYNAGHGAKRMNPTSRKYCRRVKRLI